MILTTDIMERWFERLSADADLAAWCLATFGRPLRFFVGVNPRRLPKAEGETPFIAIKPISNALGDETSVHEHVLDVILGAAPEAREAEALDGLARIISGLRLVEAEFAPRVLDALAAASDNAQPGQVAGQFDTSQFPLVLYGMRVTVAVPQVFGATITL